MDNSINNITPVENKITPKKLFKNKKLFIFVGIVLLILIVVYLLTLPINFSNLNTRQDSNISDTAVELKTEYENPFDEKAQYENPFSQESEYRNPFDFGQ